MSRRNWFLFLADNHGKNNLSRQLVGAFWDQGYKALMLTDTAMFRNPHYHQPSDTLGTLYLACMAEVCHALLAESAGR